MVPQRRKKKKKVNYAETTGIMSDENFHVTDTKGNILKIII
jgi:hypothetical protein